MALAAQKNRELFAIKKSYSIENGYPARRRSLVDDARFETLVVKQTKQSVLEEARQRSNDGECNPDTVLDFQQDDSSQYPVEPYTDSDFEAEESKHCLEPQTSNAENDKEDGEQDEHMTEEEAMLAEDIETRGNEQQTASLLVHFKDSIGGLARVLKTVENYSGVVSHVESRPSKTEGVQFDVLVRVDMTRQSLLLLIRSLRQSTNLAGATLLQEETTTISVKDPWFPRHASELDNCNHLMTKYEPELDMNHPGFSDKEYRARRKMIAEIAFAYKFGHPIPHIEYTQTEIDTWNAVFGHVCELSKQHACKEYIDVFEMLKQEGIFCMGAVPQLQDMNDFLKKHTGFTLRPAAGLLTARDFLASLAFRVFQSTQYVRHRTSPYHTPEPDCIHELLGHMPLLADPSFAQFSQEIGLASLGASDAEIEKLSTVYWFTIEFGLCKENDQVKAYGAGLLSAYGELLHAISDKPEHRPFEPALTAIQPYQDQEYQPIYYVAESFEDAKEKFRRWVSDMSRPFEVRYNPHTERIEVLDSVHRLDALVSQMNLEMVHLTNAIKKLKAR